MLVLTWLSAILLTSCVPQKIDINQAVLPSITESGSDILTEKKPVFAFSEKEFDFGKIKQSGGIVEHTFIVNYNGEVPIKITGVPTSCACTTAKIDKQNISAGESAILTVIFDPNLHEEPIGKFFKTVSILTEPSIGTPPEVKIWVEIDLDLGKEFYKLKEAHED